MQPDERGLAIVDGFKRASRARFNEESLWQAIADFFDINRASFTTSRSPGDRRTKHLFDSTGLKTSSELAATIHSIVTNPASQWFGLGFDSDFDADDEDKEWIEDCAMRMFDALNGSNFNIETTLAYRDYGNYGNAMMAMAPEPLKDGVFAGVRFRNVFLREVCVELDATNRMIGYYRNHNLTLEQARLKWPDAKLSDELERYAGSGTNTAGVEGSPNKKISFIEYVKRRTGDYDPTRPATAKNRPFSYELVVEKSKEVVKTDGRYALNHYLFTWNRAPGETYGRGLGSEALPDMRTLNEVVRMDLESTAMRIKPPMKTRYNNVVGDIRVVPGGLTICRDPAGLMPFDTGANVSESKLRIEDLRMSVRSIYLLDKLALPPRDQVGEMTAYEVQRRVQEMNQVLGPILARLNDEYLQPMIEDLFFLMLRTGGFAEMPDNVRNAGAGINIRFVNPLSRAQKAEEMAAVQLWLQDLMALANAGKPEVLDLIDDDALARGSAETRGVPNKYITDKAKVKEVREERAEMQRAQQEAEINAKNADAQYKMQQGADQGGRPTETA